MKQTRNYHWLRRQVYTVCGLIDQRVPLITILCYHSIGSRWFHSVTAETFQNQINALTKKYDFITLNDVYLFLKGEKQITRPSIVLTFDDGYADVLNITDFLAEKGITPTMFLLSSPLMVDRKEMDNTIPLLTVPQIKELISKNWEIGCHSATHPDFNAMNDLETHREIIDAKTNLEELIGHTVRYFSYPKGRYTTASITAVQNAGYRLGVSMDDEVITKNSNRFILPRIGINSTHRLTEFLGLNTNGAIYFRKFVKNTPLNNLL